MSNLIIPVCLAGAVGAGILMCRCCASAKTKVSDFVYDFFETNTDVQKEINQEAVRWRGHGQITIQHPVPGLPAGSYERLDFWSKVSVPSDPSQLTPGIMMAPGLPNLLMFPILFLRAENGVAVDLGCGISDTAHTLLQYGYTVHCIDYSMPIIQHLTRMISSLTNDRERLRTWCGKIEDYQFPSQVDLITAVSSLTYCDPNKINSIFQNIFRSLKQGGFFIGNLFALRYASSAQQEGLREMGAWFVKNKQSVSQLLTQHGFKIDILEHGKSENPSSVVFLCHKP